MKRKTLGQVVRPAPMLVLALAWVLLSLAACGAPATEALVAQEFGPTMRPGANCLRCHVQGSAERGPSGSPPPVFHAAGTVYPSIESAADEGLEGVTVRLTALDGGVVELRTNAVGNFYTTIPIDPETRPELSYEGRVLRMGARLPPLAACNACHSTPPVGGAPGRIQAP
jgi:hypothetical protein